MQIPDLNYMKITERTEITYFFNVIELKAYIYTTNKLLMRFRAREFPN